MVTNYSPLAVAMLCACSSTGGSNTNVAKYNVEAFQFDQCSAIFVGRIDTAVECPGTQECPDEVELASCQCPTNGSALSVFPLEAIVGLPSPVYVLGHASEHSAHARLDQFGLGQKVTAYFCLIREATNSSSASVCGLDSTQEIPYGPEGVGIHLLSSDGSAVVPFACTAFPERWGNNHRNDKGETMEQSLLNDQGCSMSASAFRSAVEASAASFPDRLQSRVSPRPDFSTTSPRRISERGPFWCSWR